MQAQTSRSVQPASGLNFHSPCFVVPAGLLDVRARRRLLAPHAGDPGVEPAQRAPERRDLADAAAGGRVGRPQALRRVLARRTPRPSCRSAPRRRASSRRSPSNSTRVSSANTRADGSAANSMSSRTVSSFWNEQASATRGWKRSTASATTSSAVMRASTSSGVSCSVHHSGCGAAREVAERLALVVGGLVEREDPQQRLVEVPVRDLLEHDVAEARVGPEPAADADVHRLDELAVDLLEHALDADVGDLVLRAARRAAREVQPEVLAVAVLDARACRGSARSRPPAPSCGPWPARRTPCRCRSAGRA